MCFCLFFINFRDDIRSQREHYHNGLTIYRLMTQKQTLTKNLNFNVKGKINRK